MTVPAEMPLPPRAGPIIDADGHVMEPESAWATLPDHRRPRIDRDARGYEHVLVGETEILAAPLGTLGRPGSSFADRAEFRPLAAALPGGFDARARLIDMDAEGIDQAVLYPTLGLYFSVLDDPATAVALSRAYNDWLASYCAHDPRRLFGAALLPLQDPKAAALELARAVTELGFVAGFVRPNPCLGRSLPDAEYTALWYAAEELGVPIAVHEGSSVLVPTLGADRPFNALVYHAASHAFEQMLACAQLIAFGVLERHPDLRLAFLDSSGGWAPFWLDRLDVQASSFAAFCPNLALRPSEYFARQCSISFEVSEHTLPALAPLIGSDRIVWGSDYPHHDAIFPGAVDAIRDTVAPCPTATQARILGVNARHLYGLPPRHHGVEGLLADYFAAVTAHDPVLLGSLFDPDAVFDVDGEVRRGRRDIIRYYSERTFTFEDFRPWPRPAQVDGARATVDIDVHLGGADTTVRDVFEIRKGRIVSLQVRGFADALSAAR